VSEPEVGSPDWVKSLGLPPEAVAAIDRHWKPVWEELRLLPEHPRRGEELELVAVDEPRPGAGWRARFDAMWPTYRAWYLQEGEVARPDLATCREALEHHMPELVGIYERLAELAGGDDLAARLLSLYRPPAFIVGCTQAAWTRDAPMLVRNYDYPASRLEGVVCLTSWNGRRVLGMSDCLWGLLDGVNDAGLAASLTFGGRRDVGDGFAIPLVVRYVLETCTTVGEARAVLERVPVHAAQNVTVLDRSGAYLTAYVGPGRPPQMHEIAATTNHQGDVEWPEYSRAIRSEERERCVLDLLADPQTDRERFVETFLEPPLHNTQYEQGFGTIYTGVYHPAEGRASYRWPGYAWDQSFEDFSPGSRTVRLPSSNASTD
jgi:predicted choloylglycine hydrolase